MGGNHTPNLTTSVCFQATGTDATVPETWKQITKGVREMEDTVFSYRESVENIAKEAIDEYPDDEEGRKEYVNQSVDGSHWVIYYHANEIVLQASSNEPDGDEVREMSKPDADWRDMRMLAAFMAMEADVNEEIEKLLKERDDED